MEEAFPQNETKNSGAEERFAMDECLEEDVAPTGGGESSGDESCVTTYSGLSEGEY